MEGCTGDYAPEEVTCGGGMGGNRAEKDGNSISVRKYHT